ncbi:hypothetical protein Cgig2_006803 [Carnegiea gigantea]|uniref:Uncharacterized protein n=1 Tax=Carnegiea gigantea TaxID=171969 RepID=A0A9Q1GWW6_9CARY|nr:hypothetical protein Cgig2_006803 [Carnegiea gigantea]
MKMSFKGHIIWSRIGRAFTNVEYDHFDFAQVDYLTEGLSDHSPYFYPFQRTLKSAEGREKPAEATKQIKQQELSKAVLEIVQLDLQQDLMDSYRQSKEKEAREHYVKILDSSILLLQPHSKASWINYCDQSISFFFTKIKQSKQAFFVYSLKDSSGNMFFQMNNWSPITANLILYMTTSKLNKFERSGEEDHNEDQALIVTRHFLRRKNCPY